MVDEVHQAKNPKGQLHKASDLEAFALLEAIVALNAPRKLGLTGFREARCGQSDGGTPLQNSLTDVGAVECLGPGSVPRFGPFSARWKPTRAGSGGLFGGKAALRSWAPSNAAFRGPS